MQLTPKERIIWDVTADGLPHTYEEILKALDPEADPKDESNRSIVHALMWRVRQKLVEVDQTVIGFTLQRGLRYIRVKLLVPVGTAI